MDWAKTTARRDENHLSLWFGASYIRDFTLHNIISARRIARKGDFEEIGLEIDHANFLSVPLTKPYRVNMAKLQQIRQMSYICHERIGANLTVTSWGISEESVGAKFTRNRSTQKIFVWKQLEPHTISVIKWCIKGRFPVRCGICEMCLIEYLVSVTSNS